MGMYVDEYQGNIIWNDTEMRNLDMDYIREHVISVTEQEPTLIADTIYNNIALYRKLDVKCIQRAVDCFGDSILKRDNWDLQINEKSSNISGGEKQKIAIIKAIESIFQIINKIIPAEKTENINSVKELMKKISTSFASLFIL